MTTAYNNFKISISESLQLAECFDELNNNDKGFTCPDALKKASLVMALTAWETYVEDVVKEKVSANFKILEGSQVHDFVSSQLDTRLKMFHNPGSCKTKQLFEEFFGYDVTNHWKWNNTLPMQAREQLNALLSKRGDAVHRGRTCIHQPSVIKRDELHKAIRFIKELVRVTDEVVEAR
ncbi:HEPN domain-containing protein [Pseudoalteromonas sp. T1lg88]|uniref:HEPN domain-containing protein n=1 Tax=Pseudoalteromonas sp. T1lg88 TaxID=2077104 RepID=UPI000CF71110|nr:HEPN domain-containing protein [Pseudoalteromonas sp. T1lg88]